MEFISQEGLYLCQTKIKTNLNVKDIAILFSKSIKIKVFNVIKDKIKYLIKIISILNKTKMNNKQTKGEKNKNKNKHNKKEKFILK